MTSREEFPCPFERYETDILPEWIDINGHMNMAYYGVVFDRGNYAAGDALGLGADYVEGSSHGIFAAETHTLYFRELHLGDRLRVRTQIVSADTKRLHFAHEIYHIASGERAAAQEVMYLHVNLTSRRVTPFLDSVQPRIEAAREIHASLPIPDWCGRRLEAKR
ncbi:thioesterase family protein [Bradyrhizobium sp.]|uniref:thioesterase family protein n=1 Tax=Bradyrhizobium sp. TaxID=376 RepID=UPI0039E58898